VAVDAVLTAVQAVLDDHFGHHPVRASVSFLGVEPIEVLRYEPIPGEIAYISLGMSRRPMTAATAFTADPAAARAELMLHLRHRAIGSDRAWRSLAVLAAAPAVEGVVYTSGMTIDLGQPFASDARCTGAVVIDSPLPATEVSEVAPGAAAVQVLQVLPATAVELAWARVHGTSELRRLWAEQKCDLLDLARGGAALPSTQG
jgi:hypothetical protein